MNLLDISQTQEIYTVTRLSREVRFILEGNFPLIWLEGEISNFSTPNSGHWYFSVKDNNAQIRCAMFRMNNRNVSIQPKEGSHVLIKARVSLYEGRGDFQLIVEHMEEIGEGKLRQAFEALKKKLFDAGMFDPKFKKPLPAMPKAIGVITSATGAAIRDILSVLKRRFCCAPVIIYPSLVQGETAAYNLIQAIKLANERKECDVIILARGGGSLEDLWPFNEEQLAEAIFASELPIVSGVGHEVDFTICDFVADIRAPTPSAAAELVVPHCDELLKDLQKFERHLLKHLQQTIAQIKQQLVWSEQRLQQQHPKKRFAEKSQRLDLAEATLIRLMTKLITQRQTETQEKLLRLQNLSPNFTINRMKDKLDLQHYTLQNQITMQLQSQRKTLANLSGKLNALSPLATLERGFAIVTQNEKVIRSSSDVSIDEQIEVKLSQGKLVCLVNEIE